MTVLRFGCGAALAAAFGAFAQRPPAPIWPADGKIPESLKDHYVFLTPDLGTVVVALPDNETGERKILRLTIHNRIRATVSVDMKIADGLFRYDYFLFNAQTSRDGVTGFGVVVSPDPDIRTAGESWPGGAMFHSDAKRVGLSGAQNGRWVLWSCPLKDPKNPASAAEPLKPGSSTRFVVESLDRPGFTTASADQFPPFEISSDWPEQVILQANPLQDLDWVDKHVITFGPRYAPGDSANKIAADYLSGMADLIKEGRLDPKSPFVQRTTESLNNVAAGETPLKPFGGTPSSRLEGKIKQALGLCFGVPPS